jgi:hypothetical protein
MIRLTLVIGCLSLISGCGWGVSMASGEDRRTPLEKAAMNGDADEVRRLLASGANPNEGGLAGSPLHAAAFHGNNVEIIHMLIAAGANPNGPPGRPVCSPLSNAASRGDIENIRALLDAGASVRQPECPPDAGWLTPQVMDLLVQHGLDLKGVDGKRAECAAHRASATVRGPLRKYRVRDPRGSSRERARCSGQDAAGVLARASRFRNPLAAGVDIFPFGGRSEVQAESRGSRANLSSFGTLRRDVVMTRLSYSIRNVILTEAVTEMRPSAMVPPAEPAPLSIITFCDNAPRDLPQPPQPLPYQELPP